MPMLLAHRNHPDVRRWLGNSESVTEEQNKAFWASTDAAHYRIATYGVDNMDVGLIRISYGTTPDGNLQACVGADVFRHIQGRGMGYRVFAEACKQAGRFGAHRLWLKVFLHNTRALKIYLNYGFEFTGEIEDVRRPLPGDDREVLLRYATMERRPAVPAALGEDQL
jgi:RimJ/RimL family protein N-acetyltransferase